MPRHRTGEQPQIQIGDATAVSLRWVVGLVGAALVLGGSFAVLQAQASSSKTEVAEFKTDQKERHAVIDKERADTDKRLALVERAVVSLEKIAEELKKERKNGGK